MVPVAANPQKDSEGERGIHFPQISHPALAAREFGLHRVHAVGVLALAGLLSGALYHVRGVLHGFFEVHRSTREDVAELNERKTEVRCARAAEGIPHACQH